MRRTLLPSLLAALLLAAMPLSAQNGSPTPLPEVEVLTDAAVYQGPAISGNPVGTATQGTRLRVRQEKQVPTATGQTQTWFEIETRNAAGEAVVIPWQAGRPQVPATAWLRGSVARPALAPALDTSALETPAPATTALPDSASGPTGSAVAGAAVAPSATPPASASSEELSDFARQALALLEATRAGTPAPSATSLLPPPRGSSPSNSAAPAATPVTGASSGSPLASSAPSPTTAAPVATSGDPAAEAAPPPPMSAPTMPELIPEWPDATARLVGSRLRGGVLRLQVRQLRDQMQVGPYALELRREDGSVLTAMELSPEGGNGPRGRGQTVYWQARGFPPAEVEGTTTAHIVLRAP